ncbi:PTS sugar transporter subunit IIB [Lacticaseibacillus saniviri]|uniref:PTS system mannose fructose N-acetylgalactosamine-specific transporter subunit IIB n=1 Tax=Lacticaseibacillus saniviri JCM 17471 = DSM 24301 TaxID=1293598 RepID=A0A0R2MWN3_9LACO|nr:PTS sugar transporter subunit IIB [Lacticaseibacillus saniviri]KRO17308.1 PTS system mannose fructose N-acetylgalactosamine-specific transporter subunit IIB [Lacticaseibacillus saniviri JCM 17471 = DSM 24301]MCG4282667.1 PTS sugar transporter subunit IIB [Lacticaseibacillus saniviri]
MTEPNIKAIRLDERLIHGQGRLWIANLGVNLVIVANDEVSTSHIQQQLMKSMMPDSIGVRFFSIQETIDKIFKASPRQTIFIIVKTAKDVERLAEGGVPIKDLNVGNIHMSEGKTRLTNFIAVDAEDLAALKTLREKYHVNFNTRTTPIGNEMGSDFDLNGYVETH